MVSQRPLHTSLLLGLALAFGFATAGPAAAQKKEKSVQTEADWVAYDADAQTVTVKVVKPGSGAKGLSAGKDAVFNVKAEGTVLTRTTVKVNGKAGKLTDIMAGKRVMIYWKPDEKDPNARFARSIDVTFSEEELNERYPDADAN
jgi:hypothetical protein